MNWNSIVVTQKNIPALCFAGSVSIFVFLAWGSPGWHDTAEFAAVGRLFSISHSPGHPLYTLLSGGASVYLPFADIGFRAAFSSGVFTALACLFIAAIILEDGDYSSFHLFWLSGVFLSAPVLFQTARSEVYTLQAAMWALCGWCLYRWCRRRDARYFLIAGFVLGLSGGNHIFLAVLPLPIVLILVLRQQPSMKVFCGWCICGAFGFFVYALLPIRSDKLYFGWGSPTTFERLLMMMSGRDWAANFGDVDVDLLEQLLLLGEAFVHELGVIAFPVALIVCCSSVFVAIKMRHWTAQFAFAVGASFLIGRCLLTIDRGNPDLMGYLLPGYLSIATGCLLTAKLYQPSIRRLGVLLGIVFLLATIGRLEFRPSESAARRYAEQLFSEVEPDGVLVTSLYSSWFWTWYLQGVLGHRPDVVVLFRGRLKSDWHRERLSKRFSSVRAMPPLGWLREHIDHARWEPGVEFRGLVDEFNLVPDGITYHSGELGSPRAVAKVFRNVFEPQVGGDKQHEVYIRYEHLRSVANEQHYREFVPVHRDALRPYEKSEPRLRELLEVNKDNFMIDQQE